VSELTRETIEELRALLAKATPGEWFSGGLTGDDYMQTVTIGLFDVSHKPDPRHYEDMIAEVWENANIGERAKDNAALIVALANAAPRLLADSDALARYEAKVLWEEMERQKAATIAKLPDERAAICAMTEAFHRMRDFGWSDAIYCPKDGSSFEVIEAGSSGIHRAHYSGEWPTGTWWIEEDGDLSPSRPILFRFYPEDEAKRKAKMAAAIEAYRHENGEHTPKPETTP